MKKYFSIIIMIFCLSMTSRCSTYNSIVPNWMEIGSSSSEVEQTNEIDTEKYKELIQKRAELEKLEHEIEILEEQTDSDWSWWNPFSWF